MKRLIFILFLIVGVCQLSAQDNVFSYTVAENIVTQNAENTKAVNVDRVLLDKIISEHSNDFFLKIPLINESFLNVNMKKFSILSPEHNLIIERSNGQETVEYIPDFQSYYILFEGNSIGTFLYFENSIVISYKYNNRQFEINKIDNEFLLFDINDCLINNTFTCEVEEKIERINIEENYPESSFMTPKCLELAIETDKYTRNTFSSNASTTNWAHAILSGVSQVYASEVNLNISIVTTIIWETTDPYASYINNASNMLAALRNHWTSNNGSISRDLVHLMTKRTNTGTGGIAYRDVLCSNSWGYSFSAKLNNTTNFNFPNPSYTWNLMVCSHEIGHNIESHHTHWCGWPGGPIDNCTDVEGSCTNNPTPQVGTIMSYCHTTSSGSLIDFHSIVVSNALTPGINGASCLTTCTFYGCTDPSATNYDSNATVDDGSCTYLPPVLTAITTNISCNDLSDGSIDLSVSGGLSPYIYVWSNGLFSQDISNLLSGTYTVSVTDALGQTANASYNITEPAVITPIYTVTNTTGSGMSNGSISVSVSGGTPPYTYYWIGYASTSSTLYNLSAGTYVSYILDANNCYIVDSIDVIDDVPTPLQLTYSVTDILCTGNSTASIDITVSGGVPPYSYLWSNGSTSEDLANIPAGNYIINVTDAQGQNLLDTIVVNEPLALSLSYVITNESSVGASDGSIDMTVAGGTPPFSYFWNTNPSQTTEDITNLTSGDYIVYVGFNNWTCFISDTVNVGIDPSPVYGCTDSTATNYDPSANTDDGSCNYACADNEVTLVINSGAWAQEMMWNLSDNSGNIILYGSGTTSYTDSMSVQDTCLVDGCYRFNMYDSWDGWNGGTYDIYVNGSLISSGGLSSGVYGWESIQVGDSGTCVLGCTDPLAFNYNPAADFDDGSCLYCSSCGAITGVNVSDIIHDRATFNWNNMNSFCCNVDQIRIRYREVSTNSWSTKTMGSPTGSGCNTSNISKLILSLTPSTTYEYDFKIWYCNASTVNWHAYGTFTTLDECPIVDAFSATPLNPTKVQFDWSLNGVYEFVRIKLREDYSGATWFNAGGFGVNYPAITKNKNGLLPGQTYRGQARTWCDPNGGAYRSATWTPLIFWNQPTSVRLEGENTAISNLEVYPNPSRDVFNITFTSIEKQDLEIRIINVIGENIFIESKQQFIGQYTKQIMLGKYPKAIYFLEIETDNGVINKKLILQ